jgi:hypothetical protein
MGRAKLEGVGVVAACLGLLVSLGTGCATLDSGAETEPKQSTGTAIHGGEAEPEPALRACHAQARLQQPDLAVHTVALYFARDGKVVFADVELPEAPALARCLADAMLGAPVFGPAVEVPQGAIVSGARRIDLGPPQITPTRRPTPPEVRARYRKATLAALRQGVLRESDPLAQAMRTPSPAWPTAEMRAQLDACHRDAARSWPGLVVHREVIYLARGAKLLLADVNIPEAPELKSCVLEKIGTWSSPFPTPTETQLSSFFVDLGGPEQFPDPPLDLVVERSRRLALIDRAIALGLIAADDPLRARLSAAPAATAPVPAANGATLHPR